jgi:hypothetical protein
MLDKLQSQLKDLKPHYLLFGVLLTLYIVLNVQTPDMLAPTLDSIYGTVLIVLFVILIAFQTTPVLGLLAAIAGYFLIKRSGSGSSSSSGDFDLQDYLPSSAAVQYKVALPASLEEEIVAHMAPLVTFDAPASVDYKPVLAAQYDAAPVDYDGVV